MKEPFANSYIYLGKVSHRRFSPKKHSFNYSLFMLAFDLSDLENQTQGKGLFGFSWFHPLRFVEKDYIKSEPKSLRYRITNKVKSLNGHADIAKVIMLVQVRCFGLYFSPANFYFCYDSQGKCTQMLAEVSNTPWNERHYYLVNLLKNEEIEIKKNFQVSPFMGLDMSYRWRVKPPNDKNNHLMVNIENRQANLESSEVEKLFDANLLLHRKAFTRSNLLRVWCQLPVMTLKVVLSIYWQALKLFLKRIPFIGYQKAK